MSRYLPNIFGATGEEQSEANNPEETQPPPTNVEERLTRSRSAARGLTLHIPGSIAEKGRQASRSPNPPADRKTSFFPTMAADEERMKAMMEAAVAAAMAAMQSKPVGQRRDA